MFNPVWAEILFAYRLGGSDPERLGYLYSQEESLFIEEPFGATNGVSHLIVADDLFQPDHSKTGPPATGPCPAFLLLFGEFLLAGFISNSTSCELSISGTSNVAGKELVGGLEYVSFSIIFPSIGNNHPN